LPGITVIVIVDGRDCRKPAWKDCKMEISYRS